MQSHVVRRPNPDQKLSLEDYWRFRETRREELASRFVLHVQRLRVAGLATGSLDGACADPDDEIGLHDAIFADRWDAYVGRMRMLGERYALEGVANTTWMEAVRFYRDVVRAMVFASIDQDPGTIAAALRVHAGLVWLLDIASDAIGQAYLDTSLSRVAAAAEERLHHLQKMEAFGRFAGGMAHDFNNVLTVVETYACLLEESLPEGDQRREDAAEIRRAGERAARITHQFRAMSRVGGAGESSLDLNEVVGELLPMLRRMVGRSIEVIEQLGSIPPIVADRTQMEQVLMNLVANARDAMARGGRVAIETSATELDAAAAVLRGLSPGRYVELSVTDTGSGMDATTQARIFDPFFTTKDVGKGTGLGLSIVHGIVVQARGALRVYSEVGYGTTFRVYLPATERALATATAAPVRGPTTLPPVHVLVVDDQPEVRTVAARILRDAGCQVVEVGSAEEARRTCVSHEGPLELVLLDLTLGDGRGDVLIDELRAVRPGLKFLTMSGYPTESLSARGTTPADFLAKPFTPGELRAAVAHVCGSAPGPGEVSELPAAGVGIRKLALIVDDDEGLRRTVVRVLRGAGFECAEAPSGEDAMAALASQRFDVVVSDVLMPRGGGLELLRAVRRVDLDVPVILMTGVPSLDAAADAVQFGAFRYLTKPFDLDVLVNTAQAASRAHTLARLRREALAATGAHPALTDRASLEVRFQHALDSMWMAFQPIVHARTGSVLGVEALMRCAEPSLPTPEAVLDAAAGLGRLPILGRRVRRLVADAMAARDELLLFVNVHSTDLADAALIDPASPLAAIAPWVILEVTERASLAVSAELQRRLERLRALGFRIAVDNVGAGYSGLTAFAELAPEFVKLDMSLVRDVHRNVRKQRTIAALTRLFHEGNTPVIAEGVETGDDRDALIDLGCDLLQGYLFGHPQADLPR